MKRHILIIGVVFICLLAESCASRKSEPLRGPLEFSSPQVKNGQVLYMEHCQKCHPLGEAGLAPAINSNPAPGFLKRFQVRHGLGVMPSFKEEQITTKELMDLSEYLKAMKQK